MKDDKNKPDYTLVPVAILDAIEKVREYGTGKYEDRENWKSVSPVRYWRAFLRHTRACWDDPYKIDAESGLPHLWHIACNLAFILEMQEEMGKAEDLKQKEPKQEKQLDWSDFQPIDCWAIHVTDGTLFLNVPKGTEVGRVIVSEMGTLLCRTFYQDGAV